MSVVERRLRDFGFRAIAGTDEGIWRRLRLIPFTVTIPEAEIPSTQVRYTIVGGKVRFQKTRDK